MTKTRKKLIEVALPIREINEASVRDKNLSSKHPTTLHYWWAPRPLPACRAVVFASLVDDPSSHPDRFPDRESQEAERKRLFTLMEKLIQWENRNDEQLISQARKMFEESGNGQLPTILDPFCGRGLIPLEGQRLGLPVIATDLNPVAVTIARTLLEIIVAFRDVGPIGRGLQTSPMDGIQRGNSFSDDIEYFADMVLRKASGKLKKYFPDYPIDKELVDKRPDLASLEGATLPLMGWIWARTAKCANPSCTFDIPLVGSFWLSKKKGRRYWIQPILNGTAGEPDFEIQYGDGEAPPPTKIPRTGGSFRCPHCGEISADDHVLAEGEAGRIGHVLMACVADGGRSMGRVYLPPTNAQDSAARSAQPSWSPSYPIPDYSQAMPTSKHGVKLWSDLYTPRQLLSLETFAEAIREVRDEALRVAETVIESDDPRPLSDAGRGPRAYGDAVATFLAIVLGKYANRSCAFCFWDSGSEKIQHPFAQQGIQKTWDFIEGNPFSGATASWKKAVEYPLKVARDVRAGLRPAIVAQAAATECSRFGADLVVITDPPYYDNMGYADLSDSFYIWLRRALADTYPSEFGTVLTPKEQELAAVRHKFDGSRQRAEEFFVKGFRESFEALAGVQSEEYPLSFFYAYKQKRTAGEGLEISTGWETALQGLMEAGLSVVATWPILTESVNTIKKGKASLSTSVVVVCRKRQKDAVTITRGDFRRMLKQELPSALENLKTAHVAPADLPQASIGMGMAVFSRYAEVVEADGSVMSVRSALAVINEVVDEVRGDFEGDLDPETRFALTWYETFGFDSGPYGVAENIARARNIPVKNIEESGVARKFADKVRLLKRDELDDVWSPETDDRLTVWEATQHLIKRLEEDGERAAAALLTKLGTTAEQAHNLAYRLYTTCERKKWAEEAQAYNGLVLAWPELEKLASEAGPSAKSEAQPGLFEDSE